MEKNTTPFTEKAVGFQTTTVMFKMTLKAFPFDAFSSTIYLLLGFFFKQRLHAHGHPKCSQPLPKMTLDEHFPFFPPAPIPSETPQLSI